MSLKDDKQQNIQIELDSLLRRRVKPERREGEGLKRPGRQVGPKTQPARID